MNENFEKKLLQAFIDKWWKERFQDFFREVAEAAKTAGIDKKDAKLFIITMVEDSIKRTRTEIESEKFDKAVKDNFSRKE